MLEPGQEMQKKEYVVISSITDLLHIAIHSSVLRIKAAKRVNA